MNQQPRPEEGNQPQEQHQLEQGDSKAFQKEDRELLEFDSKMTPKALWSFSTCFAFVFVLLLLLLLLLLFVLKSRPLQGFERQQSREKFVILTLKPQSHVKILIYRTRAIRMHLFTHARRKQLCDLHDNVILMLLPESSKVLLSCANQSFENLNLTLNMKEKRNEFHQVLVVRRRNHCLLCHCVTTGKIFADCQPKMY